MADIHSIDMRNGEIVVSLRISRMEYELLRQETRGLVLLPTSPEALNEALTTGKLGNSNRIMLPKKYLKQHNLPNPPKRVAAKIFEMNSDAFLLIKLKEERIGVPVFEEGE